MVTVVNTPTPVRTVRYGRLIAHTLHVVQPDRSGPWPVEISKYSTIVSKIHKRKKNEIIQYMHFRTDIEPVRNESTVTIILLGL